jgi:hypothetical protein
MMDENTILELLGAGIFWLLMAVAVMIVYGWFQKKS